MKCNSDKSHVLIIGKLEKHQVYSSLQHIPMSSTIYRQHIPMSSTIYRQHIPMSSTIYRQHIPMSSTIYRQHIPMSSTIYRQHIPMSSTIYRQHIPMSSTIYRQHIPMSSTIPWGNNRRGSKFRRTHFIESKESELDNGLIRRSFSFFDCQLLKRLYTTFVRPHIGYAQAVWVRTSCVGTHKLCGYPIS